MSCWKTIFKPTMGPNPSLDAAGRRERDRRYLVRVSASAISRRVEAPASDFSDNERRNAGCAHSASALIAAQPEYSNKSLTAPESRMQGES
jgi:hypothetical protein